MDTVNNSAGTEGEAIAYVPFDCRHPIDMMSAAQRRLFVVAALIDAAETCSDHQFRDCEEEASTLIEETRKKVKDLIDEFSLALEFLCSPEKAGA